jgi:homoserine dehydrogenase
VKKINIGLVGAGTVGKGLIQILNESKIQIFQKSGIELNLTHICDKDDSLSNLYSDKIFTKNFEEITTNPQIDIIVELIGGTGIAYDVVRSALMNRKAVVTANKALLSEKGEELFSIAEKNTVEIGYEASVAGTIPIIRSLKTGLIANDILAVYGILNGTTNFILSKMEKENWDYETALKEAQNLGFAEKDPTFDVEGIDAAHKVSILTAISFGQRIDIKDIYIEGITKISQTEIQTAKQLGYRIKLLGIAKISNGNIEARVQPTMVPLKHSIASIMNEMNAVYIESNYSGPLMFSGKGAGSLPTASAVVSDLVYYGGRIGHTDTRENMKLPKAQVIPHGQEMARYYIRFNTVDKPGVIAELSKQLGINNVSIASVRQDETEEEPVEVIILTHKCKEKDVQNSINSIDQLPFILKKSVILRLEDLH